MKYKNFLILCLAVSFLSTGITFTFSQEQDPQKQVPPEAQAGSEPQWLWGEVASVDNQKGELLVQYLDYDTDLEKEVNISVDGKTAYENTDSLIDIKPGDAVSIDFLSFSDGRNIAKKISVEKPETVFQPPANQ